MKLRRSPQTALVMAEFLQEKEEWKYGYHLSRNTGLRSGTLYPILMRLASHGLLETSWEATSEGRPPRHLYKLTRDGLLYAQIFVRETHGVIVGNPAIAGAGGR